MNKIAIIGFGGAGFCGDTGTGTYKSVYRAERNSCQDQYSNLASRSASGACGGAAGDDHPSGVYICK